MMSQRKQESVVDGHPRIVYGVYRAEVWIDKAVNRTKVRRCISLSIRKCHGCRRKRSGRENGLLIRRYQVQIETEIAIRLPCNAVRVSEKTKTVTVNVSSA